MLEWQCRYCQRFALTILELVVLLVQNFYCHLYNITIVGALIGRAYMISPVWYLFGGTVGTPLRSFRAFSSCLQLRRVGTVRWLNLCHIPFSR